nr:GspH/FimT family pseudopilin [Spartinivicinus marinus]
MAFISAPGFERFIERGKLEQFKDELYTQLIFAKSEAIKRNKLISVVLYKKTSPPNSWLMRVCESADPSICKSSCEKDNKKVSNCYVINEESILPSKKAKIAGREKIIIFNGQGFAKEIKDDGSNISKLEIEIKDKENNTKHKVTINKSGSINLST